jgi:hypothetical protein
MIRKLRRAIAGLREPPMKRIVGRSVAFAAILVLPLGLTAARALEGADAGDTPAPADRAQIDHWKRQLGDNDFDTREAAARELKSHEEARPFLRATLKSPDAELRKRAADILAALDRKRAPRELDKALDLAQDGRIDEAVERLVRWQGADDGRKGWDAVYRLASKAAEKVDRDYAADAHLDLKRFPRRSSPAPFDILAGKPTEVALPYTELRDNKSHLIRGQAVDLSDVKAPCGLCIFAASRSLRLPIYDAGNSVIVCGGDVDASQMSNSIVICDGDFTAHLKLFNCIVIANGKATCPGLTSGAFISAREVEFPHGGQKRSLVRTGDVHPLDFIRFFDPSEAGVEASAEDDGGRVPDGVLVKSAAKDKPFAAAGLQAGDIITAVGDEKIDASGTADDQFQSFRRPLRKMLAADEEFTLAVRRGDKTIELTVKPAD